MAALMPVMEYLEQSGKFVQCVKLGAQLQGLTPGPVRLPMLALDDEMTAQVTQVIKTAAQQLEQLMAG